MIRGWRERRRAWVIVRQRRELVAWLDRMNTLAPCDNPDCTKARDEFRIICEGGHP